MVVASGFRWRARAHRRRLGRRAARPARRRTCGRRRHRRPLCSDLVSLAGVAGVGCRGARSRSQSALRVASERTMSSMLVTVVASLCGAGLAVVLHLPVPWFTGPLLATAFANMAGRKLRAVPYARDGGQWIIGTALGLYFTPDVMRVVIRLAPWIAANLAFCVLLGGAGALLLRRFTRESGATSFFAMAIGGASEMAAQAERYGARVDRVAAAHSLRMMMVALIVPFALQTAGVHGADPYEPAARTFDPV